MIRKRFAQQPINLQAVFWILLCKFCFVTMMAMAKASTLPTMQINFCRSFSICFITACIIFFNKKLTFKTANPKLQLLKVSIGAFGMIGYFYAFRHLEMSKATTLGFTQSLVLPVFAALFLKERIGWRRVLAILVGYGGILVAIDPFYGSFEIAEGIILLASVCGAFAVVVAKKLTAKDSPILLMFYSGLSTSVILATYYALRGDIIDLGPDGQWTQLTSEHVDFFFSLVGISFAMQYSYLKAYSLADAGFLAPFNYVKFLISVIFSYFLFAQLPARETLIGSALIIGSTLYLIRRELHMDPQYQYKNS